MARIRPARRGDNEGLLSLTAMTPMDGEISIRSDRYPDFFRLLERRGPARVMVAEEDGEIVGSVSAARVPVFVEGAGEYVHYLGDLKVHPSRRGTGLSARLLKAMVHDMLAGEADLVLSTAAYGNDKVLPFFGGRAGLPPAIAMGVFRVYQLLPSRRAEDAGSYEIGEEPEHPDLHLFYNASFREYQFGPIIGPGTLRDAHHWVARAGGEIQAAISLVDIGDSRQNVIIGLPPLLEGLVTALRAVRRVAPVVDLPAKNTAIRTLHIKALACRTGREDALDSLIRKARNLAAEEGYHFVAIGLHERDPLGLRLARIPKFTFKSLGFLAGLRRGPGELARLTKRVPYEDYSLV